ncbi:MAG: flagellar biosynthesis anti-sigma factor FlgM [Acidobacteria bacterium]|nr:flagellar biosynthesis anti-sigma factor FlgM [Acidobacteriota bacterium]
MRINDQNSTGISSSQIGRTQETEAGGRSGRAGGSAAAGDQVELSSLAERLRETSADMPERAAYLRTLSAEIQAGEYQVDAAELGRKIVDSALAERG